MRKKHINASLVMFYLLNCGVNTAMYIATFFLNSMRMYMYIMCAYYTYMFNFIYNLCHISDFKYVHCNTSIRIFHTGDSLGEVVFSHCFLYIISASVFSWKILNMNITEFQYLSRLCKWSWNLEAYFLSSFIQTETIWPTCVKCHEVKEPCPPAAWRLTSCVG